MFKLTTFPSTHLATTFCYSSHHVSKKGYSHDLDYLPAVDWADMNKLASIHVSLMIVPSMDASLKQWVNTFKRVGSIEAKASVSVYALEIAKYLESKEGEDLYREAFDLELSNKSLNQRAEAVGKNTRKVLKLKEAQKLNQEEHQSIASSSSTSRHLKAKIVIKRPLEFEEVPVQKARRTLRSKSTLDSAATLFSEHSFTSDDSDETYQQVEEREVQEDKIRTKTFYYMSMHEIDHSDGIKESSIKFFFDGMTFEERADLSSIEIITADKSQLLPVSFSRQFQAIVDQYRRSISFHTEVKLNDVDSMNDKEKGLSCALYLQSKQLQKQIESLPCALSMKFKSTEGNAELNFAMKHVFLLFDTLFTASDLSIDWDTTSNIYSSYPHDATQACRHDMIITSSEVLEIGTGEIKPLDTVDAFVELCYKINFKNKSINDKKQ